MVSIASEIASNKANADAPELGVSTNIRFAGSHKNHKRHNSRQSIEHKASEESVNGKPAIERDEEEKNQNEDECLGSRLKRQRGTEQRGHAGYEPRHQTVAPNGDAVSPR